MATSWHVMRSKPNREEFLARELESRDVEYYYPRLRANPVNPRARRFKAYFPGYLFIRVDLEKVNHSTLEHIPGAAILVSFGGEFSYVPENIVHAIRRKVDDVNGQGGERAAALHPGDRVENERGPFAGYRAILDANLPGTDRVRVLLQMLERRELPVEIRAEGLTIESYAERMQVDVELLKKYNDLPAGYTLDIGELLIVPMTD
ncbi:MAG TPA: transcription termination/antitermination NusG family protein [Anaerolineaceae bacterium]|nr:transcription termination/antitermination NusG family protein [Anaerolineaceae bacterium]